MRHRSNSDNAMMHLQSFQEGIREMRRVLLALVVLLVAATPVSGQDELAFLKLASGGITPIDAPEGWTAESMPLDPELASQLREGPQHRKVVQIMASYTKLGEPALGNGIDSHDVLPLAGSYSNWQGVVIANLGGARYVNVKVKATGATRQTLVGNGMYLPANSVTIIKGSWNPFGSGMVYLKTTVSGAKKALTCVCAGC